MSLGRLAVDRMTLEEVNIRLQRAFRSGLLSLDLKGPVLGFAAAMKRGRASPKQEQLARRLVRELRTFDGTEPDMLIDREDVPQKAQQDMWAEF